MNKGFLNITGAGIRSFYVESVYPHRVSLATHKEYILWAQRLGIDCNFIPRDSWIACNDNMRTVTHVKYHILPNPFPSLWDTHYFALCRHATDLSTFGWPDKDGMCCEIVIIQLEASAMPFPEIQVRDEPF